MEQITLTVYQLIVISASLGIPILGLCGWLWRMHANVARIAESLDRLSDDFEQMEERQVRTKQDTNNRIAIIDGRVADSEIRLAEGKADMTWMKKGIEDINNKLDRLIEQRGGNP